jgi:hypothetical protein
MKRRSPVCLCDQTAENLAPARDTLGSTVIVGRALNKIRGVLGAQVTGAAIKADLSREELIGIVGLVAQWSG